MRSYSFSSLDGIVLSDRFQTVVSITGDEGAIQEIAQWYSDQTTEDCYHSALINMLRSRDVHVDLHCVEVRYYSLCVYLISLCRSSDDIPSVISFVDMYLSETKCNPSCYFSNGLQSESIRLLNSDLLSFLNEKNIPSYSKIKQKIESWNLDSDGESDASLKKDYQYEVFRYLYISLMQDLTSKECPEVDISMSFFHLFKDYKDNYSIVLSLLPDNNISRVLDALNCEFLNSLERVYNREQGPVDIKNDVRDIMLKSGINHVWMTSSKVMSFFLDGLYKI